jgi:hypothetical protein
MPRYIDQSLFDNAALMAALASEVDGGEQTLAQLLTGLERDYQDEFLRDEVLLAGRHVRRLVREHVAAFSDSEELVVPLLLDLCKMAATERPDGTRRSRWFRGQLFNRQRTELPDKRQTALQHVAQYLATHMMRSVSRG